MAYQSFVINVGDDFLFCMGFADGSEINLAAWKKEKTDIALSAVFIAGGGVDGNNGDLKGWYQASLTVEASMVLAAILLCISILIGQVYQLHDTITGSMILEETILYLRKENLESKKSAQKEAEAYGKQLGNPRLWLGEYEIEAEIGLETVSGIAKSGDWEQELVMKQFHPGKFLQKYEKILEIGEKLNDDGSKIQEGNESQLYGNSTGENE